MTNNQYLSSPTEVMPTSEPNLQEQESTGPRKKAVYIFVYILKIFFLLAVIGGVLSLIYPFISTAFSQTIQYGANDRTNVTKLLATSAKWHEFVARNLSEIIKAGDRWYGYFVQPSGPVYFIIDILHRTLNPQTQCYSFTGLFHNEYFNLTISGDYLPNEQGYLAMYCVYVNTNFYFTHVNLKSWRSDAYVSIFNVTKIQFKGRMQPTSTFGPFVMHSDNETLDASQSYSPTLNDHISARDYEREPQYGQPKFTFRRGYREVVGVLIGMSIPIVLVLFALLAIVTNHFRKLCCSSDSSIAFQKFHNPWAHLGSLSAASSAYDIQSFITQSTSTYGEAMSRSCTLQDAQSILNDSAETNVDQCSKSAQGRLMGFDSEMKSSICGSSSIDNMASRDATAIELHQLPRMNTTDRLKVLFSDEVKEIPHSPSDEEYH